MRERLRLPGPLLVRLILWLLVFAVFPVSVTTALYSFQVEVLGGIKLPSAAVACSREPFVLKKGMSERVLTRLELIEAAEVDPWLRDDIRIAWITVLYAALGNSQPYVDATYRVLGCHPDQVWLRIMARREAMLRSDYKHFFGEVTSPRKPARSVSLSEIKRRGAAA